MLNLEAIHALHWGKADEIQDTLAQGSQVVFGMSGACQHLAVAKSDIHAPVQIVVDVSLMHANALIHALSVRRQAADIGAPMGRGRFSLDRSFGGDHGKRLQLWPTFGRVLTVKLVNTWQHFDPAIIFLDDFVRIMWRFA